MLNSKKILHLGLMVTMATLLSVTPKVSAQNTGNTKKASPTQSNKPVAKSRAQQITIQYNGGIKDFHSPKIILVPFAQFIEFNVNKTRYSRDCEVVTASPRHWLCKNPCSEKGHIEVHFEDGRGYDSITVKPFKIRPRHCDGTESNQDPWVESKKPLQFQLQKLGTR